MSGWWYAGGDGKVGPVEVGEIERLIQSGAVSPSTLLWREGMAEWLPLADIPEFKRGVEPVPPPLPTPTANIPAFYPMATKWPRFFTRLFDLWWESILVAFVLSAILGIYSASFVSWISRPGSGYVFSLLCLPLALTLDAAIYGLLGNTPGRALLGLQVGRLDASNLSFGQYHARNLSLWVSGLALGFPLINLFTMARQSSRLDSGQQATYDELTGFRVRAKPIGWMRRILFGFTFFGLLIVMSALNVAGQKIEREAEIAHQTPPYQWVNPVTGVSTTVESKWKAIAEPNGTGQEIYKFTEQTNHALVVLGVETAPTLGIDGYVGALRTQMAASMSFSDAGHYSNEAGFEKWWGDGEIADASGSRFSIQVIKVGDSFWRVVTVQAPPYEYSDGLVEKLQAQLLSTVL